MFEQKNRGMVKKPHTVSKARPHKKQLKKQLRKISYQHLATIGLGVHKTPTHTTQCAWCTKRPPHSQERLCHQCIEKGTVFINKGDILPGPGEKESLVSSVAREYSDGPKCIMLIVKGAHNTPAEYIFCGRIFRVSNVHVATYHSKWSVSEGRNDQYIYDCIQ